MDMKKLTTLLAGALVIGLLGTACSQNPDKALEEAYKSITGGDFSGIEDPDYQSEMTMLYEAAHKDTGETWQYVLEDFNKDGQDELFIKLDSSYNSALFAYESEELVPIYVDDVEGKCFIEPLKEGRLLETYDYWTAPTQTIFTLDDQDQRVTHNQYFTMTAENLKEYNSQYESLVDSVYGNHPQDNYYFSQVGDQVKLLTPEEWEAVQEQIESDKISEDQWLSIK